MKRRCEKRGSTAVAGGLLAAIVLSSCTDPVVEKARQDAADHQTCLDLGFKPKTEAYGNCRLKLKEIRAKEGGYSDPAFSLGVGVGIRG